MAQPNIFLIKGLFLVYSTINVMMDGMLVCNPHNTGPYSFGGKGGAGLNLVHIL